MGWLEKKNSFILQNKKLKLKYISDIKFKKKILQKKNINYFKNYLDLIKKKTQSCVCYVT